MLAYDENASTRSIQDYVQAAVHDGQESTLLSLPGESAQAALDEIWKLLATTLAPNVKAKLRKLCLKLAINSNCLPSALVLVGVRRSENDSRAVGGFADVYYGTAHGAMVAIKRLRIYTAATETQKSKLKQDFCREAILWTGLLHPNILPFLGVSEDAFPNSMCMVLPWMEKGSVRVYMDYLHREGLLTGASHLLRVHQWLYEVALGLAYLHAQGIVHGDLHPGNMLVDNDDHIRLTDFGMSLIADATSYNYASVHGGGATRFKAPELIDPDEFEMSSTRPTYQSDVYSWACTCIELYTGNVPFVEVPDRLVALRVVKGLRPPRPTSLNGDHMSDFMWSLTTSCWHESSPERPTAVSIVGDMKTMIVEVDYLSGSSSFLSPELGTDSIDTLKDPISALTPPSHPDLTAFESYYDQNDVAHAPPADNASDDIGEQLDEDEEQNLDDVPLARALYTYSASVYDPNEISFAKGEIMHVMNSEGKWWRIRKFDGTYGIGPSNYLQFLDSVEEQKSMVPKWNDSRNDSHKNWRMKIVDGLPWSESPSSQSRSKSSTSLMSKVAGVFKRS